VALERPTSFSIRFATSSTVLMMIVHYLKRRERVELFGGSSCRRSNYRAGEPL
jgi:hypothetical protein